MEWSKGDWVVRREVLFKRSLAWRDRENNRRFSRASNSNSFIPEGSPFGFPAGDWPTPDAKHPWSECSCWQGHGCLMIQKPEDAYAVWHFWHGPDREFQCCTSQCWYINLQEPFRRTAIGYDTQDLELDLVVYPDGNWVLKDDELMDQRVLEGRWSAARVADIRAYAAGLANRLDAGERWWPRQWRDWKPDPAWVVPAELPADWESL